MTVKYDPSSAFHDESFHRTFPTTRAGRLTALVEAGEELTNLYVEYGVAVTIERKARNDAIDAEFAANEKARWTDVERLANFHAREASYECIRLAQEIKALEAFCDTLRFLIDHDI